MTFLLLAIYRIGVFVPVPGVDIKVLQSLLEQQAGTLFGFFDMFTGGALKNFSIFALGIMPYISASIIIQLLTVVVPYLEKLNKEGEAGRKKITQYTRYGTIALSLFQAFMISTYLSSTTMGSSNAMIVINPGWGFKIFTMITLTAGTAFIMWLGEQITERGIGNGISLIIFAGIIARFPAGIGQTLEYVRSDILSIGELLIIVAIMIFVVAAIIIMETGHRKIPVQYAKRLVGRKMYGGQSTHIPLKVNTAGVIPPIFASSLLMFPATIAQFIDAPWLATIKDSLRPGAISYNIFFVLMIIFFCYFYTALVFNPMDVADNMKKSGGYIPGIRPGARTSDYIKRVLNRITFVGALYISAVCVLPTIFIYKFNVPFYFGGTGLLIVVGVAIDTIQQIESHLIFRHYDGFMKKGKTRGRK
jgi:preprotein translocase subunit SecY